VIIVSPAVYTRKRAKGLCVASGCVSGGYLRRGASKPERFCCKHARQHQKQTNPLRYYFDMLRGHAKARKKKFTITIEYFEQFCRKTKYLELKGRRSWEYTIDRIDPRKGYEPGNIQVLQNSDNARKQWVDKKRFGNSTYYEKWIQEPDPEAPTPKPPAKWEEAPF
jgi:hypothetical protein